MKKIKAIFIIVFTGISAYLGVLTIPIMTLVSLNIIDYITGLLASNYRTVKLSSKIGFRGIVKKVCYYLLIYISARLDWLIVFASTNAGYKPPITFLIAIVTTIWLICNEIISILENISDIGTPIPPFLLPIVKKLQSYTENTTK